MPREKSIALCEHRIIANSSSIDNDNQESLGADQEDALEAHASTHDIASSSAIPQHREGSL
jgi:hypothetical protein